MDKKNRIVTCGAAFAAMQSPIAATIAGANKPLLFTAITGMKPLVRAALPSALKEHFCASKTLAATCAFNALGEHFTAIKAVADACRIKPVEWAFEPIIEQIRAISEIGYYRPSSDYGPASKENKLYVPPDKEIIIEPVIIPVQRKSGNKTGSKINEEDRFETEEAFDWFIKHNEKYLLDFTREQVKFFIKKIMKNKGKRDKFHESYFDEIYTKCPDVYHKKGNHHGTKNKPEIIALVKTF